MLRIPSELLLALSEDAGALAAVSTTCTSRDSVGYNALQLVWPMLEANKHSGIAVGHADTPTADWHAEAGRVDRAFLERLLELAAGGPGDDDEACCQTDEAAVAASESELHLLMELLPHARHCLLPALAHHGGNVPLVSAALGSSVATARGAALPLGPGLHYVRTSAFLAAAAGGHTDVLQLLLGAGALTWACHAPGCSLPHAALELASRHGHVQAMELVGQHVSTPGTELLVAAAESGSAAATRWALAAWLAQFNAVTPFTRGHISQLQDALSVAITCGATAPVMLLLGHLDALRCHDSAVSALSIYAEVLTRDSNGVSGGGDDPATIQGERADASVSVLRCLLQSPHLRAQLLRGGPSLLLRFVSAVAACLCAAAGAPQRLEHLRVLLAALAAPDSPLSTVRAQLAPLMAGVFDAAAAGGGACALQLLAEALPEHAGALGQDTLCRALTAGNDAAASAATLLLLLRGEEHEAFHAEALTPSAPGAHPAIVVAAARGALCRAAHAGDEAELARLLVSQAATSGPSISSTLDEQLGMELLRAVGSSGSVPAATLLLRELRTAAWAGADGARCLRAVCLGAARAEQVQLLRSLAAGEEAQGEQYCGSAPDREPPRRQPRPAGAFDEALLDEALRAALVAGSAAVAGWLLGVAVQAQQLCAVRSTLSLLLCTPRAQQWALCAGRHPRVILTTLLTALAHPVPLLGCSAPCPPLCCDLLLDMPLLGLLLQSCAGDPALLQRCVLLAARGSCCCSQGVPACGDADGVCETPAPALVAMHKATTAPWSGCSSGEDAATCVAANADNAAEPAMEEAAGAHNGCIDSGSSCSMDTSASSGSDSAGSSSFGSASSSGQADWTLRTPGIPCTRTHQVAINLGGAAFCSTAAAASAHATTTSATTATTTSTPTDNCSSAGSSPTTGAWEGQSLTPAALQRGDSVRLENKPLQTTSGAALSGGRGGNGGGSGAGGGWLPLGRPSTPCHPVCGSIKPGGSRWGAAAAGSSGHQHLRSPDQQQQCRQQAMSLPLPLPLPLQQSQQCPLRCDSQPLPHSHSDVQHLQVPLRTALSLPQALPRQQQQHPQHPYMSFSPKRQQQQE